MAKRKKGGRWRSLRRRWIRGIVWISILLMLAPIPVILLYAVIQPPITTVQFARAWERTGTGERPVWPDRRPVPRERIAPAVRRAVVASEDDRFYLHYGIDFVELEKALERRERGGKLRGASTLTQQVAKNLFLWNGRSFIRKGMEAYLALLMDLLLRKDRILDLYLNLAEWGPNQFGIEAAAQFHFRKSAAKLTAEEAARLAAILPSPRRWSPRGSIATRRAAVILDRMRYAPPRRS